MQLLHGPVGAADELPQPDVLTLTHVGVDDDGARSLRGPASAARRAGRYGFTVRVVPDHPDLATPVELGLVTWA